MPAAWRGFTISPDGQRLAAITPAKAAIVVWDIETGEIVEEIKPPTTGLSAIKYSPDGRYLVLGSDQGLITYLADSLVQWSVVRLDTVSYFDFSPGGQFLLFPTITGAIELWHMATHRPAASLVHPGNLTNYSNVGFNSDGSQFFSAGRGAVRIWTLGELAEKLVLPGHPQSVPCVAFHPMGTLLASGSKDGSVIVWNVDRGNEARRIADLGAAVQTVHFSPNGRLLATGTSSPGGNVRLWDVATLADVALENESAGAVGDVTCVRFSPDGQLLAATGSAGLKLWRLPADVAGATSLIDPIVLPRAQGGYRFMAFAPDGRSLAEATSGRIRVWDLQRKASDSLPFPLLSGWHNLAFHPDSGHVLGVTSAGTIEAWNIVDKRLAYRFSGHDPCQSFHVAIDRKGKYLAVDVNPRNVTLFDVPRRERLLVRSHLGSGLERRRPPSGVGPFRRWRCCMEN